MFIDGIGLLMSFIEGYCYFFFWFIDEVGLLMKINDVYGSF